MWLTISVIGAGFGGLCAVYSNISPVLTTQARTHPSTVAPLLAAALGMGMTLGAVADGRFAERAPRATIALYAVVLVPFTVAARTTSSSPSWDCSRWASSGCRRSRR